MPPRDALEDLAHAREKAEVSNGAQVVGHPSSLRGSFDLGFLLEMSVEEAKAWLSGFKGVGPKTAACVLMFACGMPVLPVDTHVYRVSARLGLIDERTNAERAHTALEAILPPEQRYPFHIYMITHGRQVCKAQRPLCELCVVREWCDYYRRIRGKG